MNHTPSFAAPAPAYKPDLVVSDATEELRRISGGSVDLVVSSPPYNIRKSYERDQKLSLSRYLAWQEEVLVELYRILKPGASLCWQTGTYVEDGELVPLDIPFYQLMTGLGLKLRNRIIWKFNFGLNSERRFSGRYETVLWFTKGDHYKFNLDPVRVPQIYPGKRHSSAKGDRRGLPSGNPKGKNPSDYWEFSAGRDFIDNPVWDVPNVKNNHPEKEDHPCQFPIELAERCVLAFTDPGDLVLDPFVGAGSTVLAACKQSRRSVGIDKEPNFIALAEARVEKLLNGLLPIRPLGKPVARPQANSKVAKIPSEWTE